MKQCQNDHPECIPYKGPIPTRLIEVKGHQVRLVHTSAWSHKPDYLTLSHCWGGLKLHSLVKSNLHAFQQAIPTDKLCQTFKDALEITRRLKHNYIWIDSLCIVQDDLEDWRCEAAKMDSVYSGSFLNIAAANAMNGHGGCFANRTKASLHTLQGANVDLPLGTSGQLVLQVPNEFTRSVEQSALAQRPWVLQERVLSPRTAWFAAQEIFCECRKRV